MKTLEYARPQQVSGKEPIAAMVFGILSGPVGYGLAWATRDVFISLLLLVMPIGMAAAYAITIRWNLPPEAPLAHKIFSTVGWIVPLFWSALFAAMFVEMVR